MKQIKKQIFFLTVISIIFINFVVAKDSQELVNLKTKLDQAVLKVFLNRPIENWGKDIVQPDQENKQAKYSEWTKVIEEVGKFIKDSGSKELPPIYEKYFKPRYVGNAKPFVIEGDTKKPKNDIVTYIVSQVGLAYSVKGPNQRYEKLKVLEDVVKIKISILDEINNVGKSYRASTAEARDLITYLTDKVLVLMNLIISDRSGIEEEKFIIEVKKYLYSPVKLNILTSVINTELSSHSAHLIKQVSSLVDPVISIIDSIGTIKSICLSYDGNYIAASSYDAGYAGKITIWDANDKRNLRLVSSISDGLVYSLCFSPDGKYLAASNDRNVIRIFNVENKNNPQIVSTLTGNGLISILSVQFSPDGNYIASGSSNLSGAQMITIWDVQDKKKIELIASLVGKLGTVNSVSFSPDGNYIVSGAYSNIPILEEPRLKIFDFTNKENPKIMSSSTYFDIDCVSFSPDGNYIASSSIRKNNSKITIWDVQDKKNLRDIYTFPSSPSRDRFMLSEFNTVNFSQKYNYMVSSSQISKNEGSILIWDVKDKKNIKKIESLTSDPAKSALFSSDANYIVSFNDSKITLWMFVPLFLYKNFFENLVNKKTVIKQGEPAEPTGVIQYLLLKKIINYRSELKKSNAQIEPFKITDSNLKRIFNDFPDVIKKSLIKRNYISLVKKDSL